MYLPQTNPEAELVILPYAERLEIMCDDNAIRAAAARECVIDRVNFAGATTPEDHSAAVDTCLAGYVDDQRYLAEQAEPAYHD